MTTSYVGKDTHACELALVDGGWRVVSSRSVDETTTTDADDAPTRGFFSARASLSRVVGEGASDARARAFIRTLPKADGEDEEEEDDDGATREEEEEEEVDLARVRSGANATTRAPLLETEAQPQLGARSQCVVPETEFPPCCTEELDDDRTPRAAPPPPTRAALPSLGESPMGFEEDDAQLAKGGGVGDESINTRADDDSAPGGADAKTSTLLVPETVERDASVGYDSQVCGGAAAGGEWKTPAPAAAAAAVAAPASSLSPRARHAQTPSGWLPLTQDGCFSPVGDLYGDVLHGGKEPSPFATVPPPRDFAMPDSQQTPGLMNAKWGGAGGAGFAGFGGNRAGARGGFKYPSPAATTTAKKPRAAPTPTPTPTPRRSTRASAKKCIPSLSPIGSVEVQTDAARARTPPGATPTTTPKTNDAAWANRGGARMKNIDAAAEGTPARGVTMTTAGGKAFEASVLGRSPLPLPSAMDGDDDDTAYGGFGGFACGGDAASPAAWGGEETAAAKSKSKSKSTSFAGAAAGAAEERTPSGFTTASARAIDVSVAALRNGARMFGDDTAEKPARGPNATVAIASLTPPMPRRDVVEKTPAPTFSGFSTGNGKMVPVSEESMARAARFLGGDTAMKDVVATTTVTPEPPPAREKENDAPTTKTPAFAGFSTGSGKGVPISEEAMKRAANFLGDDGGVGGGANVVPASAPPKTLTTAPRPFVTPQSRVAAAAIAAPFPGRGRFQHPPPGTPGGSVVVAASASAAFSAPPPHATARSKLAFNSPMLGNGARPAVARGKTPSALGIGTKRVVADGGTNATAEPPAAKRSNLGNLGAPSVHDLFASRRDRAPLSTYFHGLQPMQRPSRSLDAAARAMTADTAIGYRVSSDDGATLTTADFRREMLDAGCKAHLLSKEYVSNACRWVVWQQACVARAFPEHLGARGALSKRAVTQRLLYRYERELIRARRPWIRRVMERDTPAGTPAVLVIAAVRRLGGAGGGGGGGGGGAEIEVTDGWYGLAARLDPALSDLLRRGKLHVGQKILVQGAELRGSAEPASPLTDAADELWLALHRNGARPAPWDATLGARRAAATFPLRTIVPNGGNVLRTLVHVERAYPPAWVESGRVDGRTIHRGDAAEARAARAFEAARAEVIERAANDVVLGNGSRYRDDLCDLTDADARREDHEDAVNKTLESKGLLERRVRRCVKLRVSGVRNVEHREARLVGSALLTTYDVDESFLSHVVEGACYELTGDLRPSAFEKAGLELAAGRKTRWRRVSEDALARAGLAPSPTPRKLGGVNDIAAGAVRRGDEFDAVAVLLHASNPMPPDAPRSQWAFALDHTSADGARLLAIEIESRTTEAFASAFEWGAGGGGDKNVHHATVLKFENLTYARRDDENALEVARATEHTRVTVLLPSGSASASAPSSSSAAAAAAAARDVLAKRLSDGVLDVRALSRRVRALTNAPSPAGKTDPPPPPPPSSSSRSPAAATGRYSIASEMEWSQGFMNAVEAAEAKAAEELERRRTMKEAEDAADAEAEAEAEAAFARAKGGTLTLESEPQA